MSSTRNAILKALQTAIAGVSGMHADRVVIGAPTITLFATHKVVASIAWQNDLGRDADGDISERDMQVVMGVMIKVDEGSNSEPLIQLGEIYDPIHAVMETVAQGRVGGLVMWMREDGSGVEASGYSDLKTGNEFSYMASIWNIHYQRSKSAS